MNSASQPGIRRILSLVWFPFFFVAAFALLSLASFPAPVPHHLPIQVVGTSVQTQQVRQMLDRVRVGGFDVDRTVSASSARHAVASGTIAGAFAPSTTHPEILIATGASGSRASYLTVVFDKLAAAMGEPTPTRIDMAPNASGDPTGVGLMFVGLPLLLGGMITSIVLVQFGNWAMRWKIVTIAVVGAFATVFTYLAATAMSVIPNDEWLLLYAFLLTQAIGWLTTGAAYLVHRYFLPVAMTFVLVLGIPSAGATVNGDMLPGFVRFLNSFMPFAQFIDVARSSAYLRNANLAPPLLILIAWALGGAAMVAVHLITSHRASRRARLEEARESGRPESLERGDAELRGQIRTTSGIGIGAARLTIIDGTGDELARTISDDDGYYELAGMSHGLYHLIVSAPHCEPAIIPIALHEGVHGARQDVVLIDWTEPSGNLILDDTVEHLALTGSHKSHGAHTYQLHTADDTRIQSLEQENEILRRAVVNLSSVTRPE